jgi:2-methylcitrate dehydratase PrpD
MSGSDRFQPERLTEHLATHWQLRHASFKDYPVCRWMHTALASFERLLERIPSAESIERIRVYGSFTLARFSPTRVPSAIPMRSSVCRWR